MRHITLGLLTLGLHSYVGFATLPLNQVPKKITLSGEQGGLVKEDKAWTSDAFQGKVSVLFYVAPGEKDLNKEATDAIKAENFPREQYQSYAIVNLAASAWPNFLIEKKLKASQEEFPHTIYVKDKQKVLVKEWNLKDDSNDVVVFDPAGKVVYSCDGKLDKPEIQKLLSVIKENLQGTLILDRTAIAEPATSTPGSTSTPKKN